MTFKKREKFFRPFSRVMSQFCKKKILLGSTNDPIKQLFKREFHTCIVVFDVIGGVVGGGDGHGDGDVVLLLFKAVPLLPMLLLLHLRLLLLLVEVVPVFFWFCC